MCVLGIVDVCSTTYDTYLMIADRKYFSEPGSPAIPYSKRSAGLYLARSLALTAVLLADCGKRKEEAGRQQQFLQ